MEIFKRFETNSPPKNTLPKPQPQGQSQTAYLPS